MQPNIAWSRFHEPIGRTLARNIAIALVVGATLAFRKRDAGLLAPFSALALWFSLGGHYVEAAFLNGIRPRLSSARLTQVSARLGAWFVGGSMLYVLMAATAHVLPVQPPHLVSCWFGGLFFIGLELFVHAVLAIRGLPNFYGGGG